MTLSAGQAITFTATEEDGAGAITWTLTPSVGTITNGYYVAPRVITTPETVLVMAATTSFQTGSAIITLMPGVATGALAVTSSPAVSSLSLTPSSVSLTSGQTASFTAAVNGANDNAAVAWSLNPPVGTIEGGVYQAPSTIATSQTVTVTATSLSGAAQTASAIVSLIAPASPATVQLTPASVSLLPGQSTQFTLKVGTSPAGAANWSLTPNLGSISNGLYTAPATVSTAESVTVTATSQSNASLTANATISLQPNTPSVKTESAAYLMSPASVTLSPGQSTQFTLKVGTSPAGAANWSLVPDVGAISNGLYTAPSTISTAESVTVIARSQTNGSLTASAAISLQPSTPAVSVSVSPSSVSLNAGQSQVFSAPVTGSSNTAVAWSMSPSVGSLSNGTYTAPATVTAQQAVTITATSAADSTKSASATVTLVPVAISLRPGSVSLAAGGSAQFTATVTGASNTSVTWSISPQVGSVTNGLYEAPATVSSAQTVTITAASVANPAMTAQATISLTPSASSLTVSPASISLNASQTQQFSASLSGGLGGGGPVSVTWSLNPAVGSITSAGLYTAPTSVSSQQNITVTATGSGTSASATVTLKPASTPQEQTSTIMLPLEVLGPNGTTVAASFNVPSSANVSGALTLAMQIHGLRFDAQASVQVNNSAWLPISTSNVTLLGLASAYGGIGGGFRTLQMTMNLPAGVVTTGANTITFKFNGTDGRVSGFRVLAFNIQDASGNQFISPSAFALTDPNTWTPPSSASSDITEGETLWRTASLTVPTSSGTQPIQAHCTDCHAQDGRDLKYFNYSNKSIEARATFHGLTAQQGMQIASYIRSLNVSNPGRPWNPPYQPGPGLDSQPVDSWSAGAGLSAVLNSDQDMLSAMFPSGVQSSFFSPTGVLDIRETPIAMQLPDWNSWLPFIHPVDAFSDFSGSQVLASYETLRSILIPGNATVYANAAPNFATWFSNYANFLWPKEANITTTLQGQQIYSFMLWTMVKSWELNHEFELEGMARSVFTNPRAEARAWDSGFPFFTSPTRSHIVASLDAIDNGLTSTWKYVSVIWYELQLILNNSEYEMEGTGPITWTYVYGQIDDLSSDDSQPQVGLFTSWLTKAIQISNNGIPPNNTFTGWFWQNPDISRLTSPGYRFLWPEISSSTRTAIYSGMVQAWLTEVQQYTPQEFWAAGYDSTAVPIPGQPDSDGRAGNASFADRMYYMIPQFRYYGVSQSLINQLAAFAQSIFPQGNWAATTTATCVPDSSGTFARCSTE